VSLCLCLCLCDALLQLLPLLIFHCVFSYYSLNNDINLPVHGRYAYETQLNVEVRVARIFNTFGPRMHPNDGRVVSNFIIQALQGKDITIYGNGEQTRSFQYVDDLVEGLIRLMNGNYSQPVNLGNPDEYTVKVRVLALFILCVMAVREAPFYSGSFFTM
jgi:hypothetical protein